MKRIRTLQRAIAGSVLLTAIALAEVQPLQPAHLTGHGLPTGPATEVLPRGALIHLQFNGLLPVIEGLEGILKAAAPIKALPPDAQNLLQLPNPLLAVVGMQTVGAPLDENLIAERFGLAAREPATVSLYLGDPRRMFIVSLPMARAESLSGLLTGILQPREVERVELGRGGAARVVPQEGPIPELYLVCSESRAYICGDRALAVSLHALPPAERMGADGFLTRALNESSGQHVSVVCDPRMIKPFVVQLAQLQPLGMMLLQQKRGELLAGIPPQARQQMEQQFRAQFGVENLEQFADYLEAVLDVTSRQLLDYVTNQLLSFEGLCFTARLDSQFPELSLRMYSQQFQPDNSTAAIPKAEIAKALRWVGSDYTGISVTGRQPATEANAGLKKWVAAVREKFEKKGLKSSWFDRFATLLDEARSVETIESRVPWTLTVNAPVDPQPDLAKAESLLAYFKSLSLPLNRAVKIVPGVDTAFLERSLKEETEVLNRNREVEVEFNRQTAGGEPWFDHENRLIASDAGSGIRRLVMESGWLTHGGIFGYDQHELVNRRWFFARGTDGYLVYHQGGKKPEWLRELRAGESNELTPAVAKILDRLPADVNSFEIHRSLQKLPQLVDWLGLLEDRIHADLQAYLAKARQVAADASSAEEANASLARLPMPELLYSLNRRPDSGELYVTLPGNLLFPRAKLIPFLQEVLAGYAQGAAEVGGSLCYTRVSPGACQVSLLQSTEAFTRLISTLGNAIAENYLGSPEGLQKLQNALWTGQDGNPDSFSQIVVANPTWNFIPRPAPKHDAHPASAIPERSGDASSKMIDLSAHYNASLDDSWHAGGMENNTLANLPKGVQEFAGVKFDVRGIVQLQGRSAAEQLSVSFPNSVDGIAINRKAAKIRFLHACGWPSDPGTVIGHYVVHYANGEQREIPITYGEDVLDWWTQVEEGGRAVVAWSGPNLANPNGPPKSLYLTTWKNPLADVEIASMDYRTTMSASAPFLIAITVE